MTPCERDKSALELAAGILLILIGSAALLGKLVFVELWNTDVLARWWPVGLIAFGVIWWIVERMQVVIAQRYMNFGRGR